MFRSNSLRGKWIFYAALVLTLAALLSPASAVLALKAWVASWLPGARWVDRADLTHFMGVDWVVHAVLFAVLGWLAMRAWPDRRLRWRWGWALLVLGLVTEGLQAWVPGRSPSGADVLADALGLSLGMFWAMWFAPLRRRR